MNDSSARNRPEGNSGGKIQNLRLKWLVFAIVCALPLVG